MLTYAIRVIWHLIMGKLRPPVAKNRAVAISFRCSPLDSDTYMHMNNASYFRVAELARWRIFPASGVFGAAIKDRLMFLAVEQKIAYKKPIGIFSKYVIVTKCDVYKDDKWIWYEHIFQQHPDDVKANAEPSVFAKIELRAVMKSPNGKTVNPSTHVANSEFVHSFYALHDTERSFKPMDVLKHYNR